VGWDPAWAQPVLWSGEGTEALWLGATSDFEARITAEMQRYPRYEDVPRRAPLSEYTLDGLTQRRFRQEWWPTAHAAWLRIEAMDVPKLWIPQAGWAEHWRDDYYGASDSPTGWPSGKLSSDWYGLIELERRLIDPYVRLAAARTVDLDRLEGPSHASDGMSWTRPIVVRERRRWTSILAPIYLQLAEALRRVSEGKAGAAFCRECDQPFLTLDARRSMFCNERERFRFAQRDRRRRLMSPRKTSS
jgi:hypothetical protein